MGIPLYGFGMWVEEGSWSPSASPTLNPTAAPTEAGAPQAGNPTNPSYPAAQQSATRIFHIISLDSTPAAAQAERMWGTLRQWVHERVSATGHDGETGLAVCVPADFFGTDGNDIGSRSDAWGKNLIDASNADTTGDIRVNDLQDAGVYTCVYTCVCVLVCFPCASQ